MRPHTFQRHALTLAVLATGLCVHGQHAWANGPLEGERMGQDTDVVEQFSFDFEKTHDRGLHLRLGTGASYTLAERTDAANEASVAHSGFGASFGLEASGFTSPGLAVGALMSLEARRVGGALGLGGVVSWYPGIQENWYVGVGGGVTTSWAGDDALQALSDFGAHAQLELGAGWWVAPETTLGLALVAGVKGLDLDGNGAFEQGAHVGVRTTVVFE